MNQSKQNYVKLTMLLEQNVAMSGGKIGGVSSKRLA